MSSASASTSSVATEAAPSTSLNILDAILGNGAVGLFGSVDTTLLLTKQLPRQRMVGRDLECTMNLPVTLNTTLTEAGRHPAFEAKDQKTDNMYTPQKNAARLPLVRDPSVPKVVDADGDRVPAVMRERGISEFYMDCAEAIKRKILEETDEKRLETMAKLKLTELSAAAIASRIQRIRVTKTSVTGTAYRQPGCPRLFMALCGRAERASRSDPQLEAAVGASPDVAPFRGKSWTDDMQAAQSFLKRWKTSDGAPVDFFGTLFAKMEEHYGRHTGKTYSETVITEENVAALTEAVLAQLPETANGAKNMAPPRAVHYLSNEDSRQLFARFAEDKKGKNAYENLDDFIKWLHNHPDEMKKFGTELAPMTSQGEFVAVNAPGFAVPESKVLQDRDELADVYEEYDLGGAFFKFMITQLCRVFADIFVHMRQTSPLTLSLDVMGKDEGMMKRASEKFERCELTMGKDAKESDTKVTLQVTAFHKFIIDSLLPVARLDAVPASVTDPELRLVTEAKVSKDDALAKIKQKVRPVLPVPTDDEKKPKKISLPIEWVVRALYRRIGARMNDEQTLCDSCGFKNLSPIAMLIVPQYDRPQNLQVFTKSADTRAPADEMRHGIVVETTQTFKADPVMFDPRIYAELNFEIQFIPEFTLA